VVAFLILTLFSLVYLRITKSKEDEK
jgi:uncharacterized membrane protein YjfL (UPF0719 family)